MLKRQKSFRKKLFLNLFGINFIFVTLLAAIYCLYTWNSGVEQREQYYVESVRNMQAQLDEMIKEMDTIACQVVANSEVQDILGKAMTPAYVGKNYFEYNRVDKKRIQKILWLFNSPVKSVSGINILSRNSLLGLNPLVDTIKIDENFDSEEWKVTPRSYKLNVQIDKWTGKEEDRVISLIREVVRTKTPFDKTGYVEIQQPYTMLESICEREDDTQVLIMDSNGQVIYPFSAEEKNYSDLLKSHDSEKIFRFRNSDNVDEMGVFTTLEGADWNVILMQERRAFSKDVRVVILLCIGIYAALLVGALLIIVAAAKWISEPIRQLTQEVQSVTLENDSGLKNLHIEVEEFQILQSSFITMTEQLRQSAMEFAAVKECELQLKIDQLQSKINPHFLYNSLTAIGAAGCEAGSETVENMCFQLSELFRYVSTDQPQIVSLQEEIDYVSTYLSFMKFRYEDAFLYEFIIQGDMKEIPLCKLVFQPIVENCFQHGFKNIPQPFIMNVKCLADETGWSFSVEDNGKGFPEEILDRLNRQFEQIDRIFQSGRNYGNLQADNMALVNVYIRLKFMYRDGVKLKIQNHSHTGGAVVSIIYRKGNVQK